MIFLCFWGRRIGRRKRLLFVPELVESTQFEAAQRQALFRGLAALSRVEAKGKENVKGGKVKKSIEKKNSIFTPN